MNYVSLGTLSRLLAFASLILCAAHATALAQSVQAPSDSFKTRPRRADASPTPEQPSQFFELLGSPFAGRKLARAESPMVGLAASATAVTNCPDANGAARVRLLATGFAPHGAPFRYAWAASGGSIGGGGGEVVWDLSGAAPGDYRATVTLKSPEGAVLAARTAAVAVRACPAEPRPVYCPAISLCCRDEVTEGQPASLAATVEGGTPGASPTFTWNVSAGRLTNGADTPSAEVDTRGLAGRTIYATFEARGYGPRCVLSCATRVLAAPVTPTPATPTPTPYVPRPDPIVIVTPTPAPSPLPTPAPPPEPAATPAPPVVVTTPRPPPVHEVSLVAGSVKFIIIGLLLALLSAASYLGYERLKGTPQEPAAGNEPPVPLPVPVPAAVPCGPEGAAAGSTAEGDEVHCTVFAPPHAAPGASFMVVAFAHLAGQVGELAEAAKERDESVVRRGSEELDEKVARGEELTFVLQMPSLEIDEPEQSFRWKGKVKPVDFAVKVPKACEVGAVNCKLLVLREGVPVGHVKFKFSISAQPAAPEPQEFVRYRNVFVSYASEDQMEVFKRVQLLDLFRFNYFQDVLSLRPGERWEKGLYKHIDDCHILLLFWSKAAHGSEWVEKEVRYALQHRESQGDGLPEILPVILQGPHEVPPPQYLAECHFNDKFTLCIEALQARQKAADKA